MTRPPDSAAGSEAPGALRQVGVTGTGTYLPDEVMTAADVADASGVPRDVVVEKMGVRRKRVCPPDDDHVSDMCVAAGGEALDASGLGAGALDLVLFHGSEYKDYVVWNAAANVADRLGAENAYAHESYALCGGTPVALRHVRAQLQTGDVDSALLVTASREEDLVDYDNERGSFMFDFGAGGAAVVLEAAPSDPRAVVRESAAHTDGRFSEDVVVPAGGSRNPPTHDTVRRGLHALDVPNYEAMKERLADVSGPTFERVADEALERSGYDRDDVDFLALTHMKRSFYEHLVDAFEVGDGHYYLEETGHVQSADQVLAVHGGVAEGRLEPGDLVLFLAAGTGYTWAATVLEWRG